MIVEGGKVEIEHITSMPTEDGRRDGEGAFVFVGDAGEGTAATLMRKEGGREGGKEGRSEKSESSTLLV